MKLPKISKSARTKELIIEKTAYAFNMKGYAGTSIADITALTGLTKGSVYGNFLNKDEIALAAFEFNLNTLYGPIKEKIAAQTHSIDKLLEYPNHFKTYYKEIFKHGGCAILNTAAEADDTHPELRKRVNKAIKSWEKSIVLIINTGKKKKEIQGKADANKYASLFLMLFEGGVLLSKSTGDKKYIFTALDQMEYIIKTDLKIK